MKYYVLLAIQTELKLAKCYYFSVAMASRAKSWQTCGKSRETLKLWNTAISKYIKLLIFNIYKIWTEVMGSTLKISSGAFCIRNCLITLKFEQLTTKILKWCSNRQNSIEFWAKISKRPLKRRYWWLKNKERKCHFRFVARRFLAAINCTGSAEGALRRATVLLRITHWTKSGLPVSPPGFFPPW